MDDVFTSKSPSLNDADMANDNAFSDPAIHVKLLIPSGAAGAVIGKDGLVITDLQRETGTKVKISKQNEFFPGTTERVCLISGSLDGVLKVHNHIASKIYEKREFVNSTYNNNANNSSVDGSGNGGGGGGMHNLDDRSRQVKLLIPDSSAGMIIGKGGSYIVQLQRSTNASIKISQRSKEGDSSSSSTSTLAVERCVTIAGDSQSCQRALVAILNKLMEDPQALSSSTYNHLNYFNPTAEVIYATRTNDDKLTAAAAAMPLFPNFIVPGMWNQNLPAIPMPLTRNMSHHHGQAYVQMMNGNALLPSHSYSNASNNSVSLANVSPVAHLLSPGLQPHNMGTAALIWNPNTANNSPLRPNPLDTFGSSLAASLGIDLNAACAVKEVQVPEEYLQFISEIAPSVQRECLVGIQIQHDAYQPINNQLPMKLSIAATNQSNTIITKWRILTIQGSPNSLFRAVDRLQSLLQQKESSSIYTTTTMMPAQLVAKTNNNTVSVVSNVPTM